ncbi:MAG TPA: DUF4912 domain-containing protein [Candidatus Omnitrophota bacterium]|nr:DUF4912 domain-containing protein [Candidatus Omnitrophota bacterium]
MKKKASKSKIKKTKITKTKNKGKVALSPRPRKKALSAAKNESVPLKGNSFEEMKVRESKFYTGAQQETAPVHQKSTLAELEHRELPLFYGDDVLVLQIRDPWWAHSYWDVSSKTMDQLRSEYGAGLGGGHWILRSYDVSYINFDGTNAHRYFDTGVDLDARNWYLNFGAPGTSWCVDLGLILPDGRFVTVLRSNTISLPLDGPSWITDEEWMIPEDEFRRLYGMSIGAGTNVSSPLGKLWQERLKKDISSRGIASMVGSPVKKPEKKPFWLVVDAELIGYGATESDAKVTVQGKPIKLRKDGTFTLRFALPDGKQEIPVVAKSAKIDETRSITPIVTRRTTRNP